MEKSISSEEKLLSVIRQKDQKRAKKGKKKSPSFTLKLSGINFVSRALLILTLVCIGYIISQAVLDKGSKIEDLLASAGQEDAAQETETARAEKVVPFRMYAAKFEQRDIFNTSFKTEKIEQSIPTIVKKNPVSTLKLVGIVLDEIPQAIIEDSGTGQTFFLKKGDDINGIVLEDIQESKVIFNENGNTFELSQ